MSDIVAIKNYTDSVSRLASSSNSHYILTYSYFLMTIVMLTFLPWKIKLPTSSSSKAEVLR